MNQDKKYFPIFDWAKRGNNPVKEVHSSKAKQKLNTLSTMLKDQKEEVNLGHQSEYQEPKKLDEQNDLNNQVSSFINKKKVTIVKRTKFTVDTNAAQNLIDAYNWYKDGNRLPNGEKSSLRNVANYFGVKVSTLATRTSGQVSILNPPNLGRKPIFTKTELQEIVNHLLIMADLGYGFTEMQAENLIRYLATFKSGSKARNFKASHGFMCHLFLQFPELTKRRAQSFDYLKAAQLTPDLIIRFFAILEDAYKLPKKLTDFELEPRNVWSMDEVGFLLSESANYCVIAKKGVRNVRLISSQSRDHITVIFCCNANGYSLEPCFLINNAKSVGKFFENCKKAGFYNPLVICTPKAYIDYSSFETWA